jgi:hypothetical protein
MDSAVGSRFAGLIADRALVREACYIAGSWRPAAAGAVIEIDDPATGDTIGVVPKLGGAETREAIAAAAAARPRGAPARPRSARSCFAAGSSSSWPARRTWPG